jgi:valyl-tRNA synthetase
MNSAYNPQEVEQRIYKFWEEKGYFHGKVNIDKKPFSVVIPPPNVTGILTVGHVMDETPQDIVVRFRRMQGYETTWVPGTDHAGIATQNKVAKNLLEKGIKKANLTREQFLEHVWKWKEEYGNTIIQQLKRLGCSCDWERLRFTMDEKYSLAVMDVFIKLYEKGLIYRGNYIINWCPKCQTALSDEEAEHREIEGGLYHIKYRLVPDKKTKKAEYIIVVTTRPETMLGDTAIAVHPNDKRYKDLIGRKVTLPLVNREIPVIADEFANPEFGSGAVKVTPAHDPNDFQMGQRHKLESISVIGPDGKMNENAGVYKGLDRFEARKQIIAQLEKEELFEKKENHIHSVGHCYRCETMIEPYLSLQWFVKMKPLAEPAIKAVKEGKVKFYPERWTKVYLEWMENIRDWCISRQLWWGHRIPVWYCQNVIGCPPVASRAKPDKCPKCGNTGMTQDPDVLDTWFSSWLWPFVVLGWPEKTQDLKYFYPTNWLNSGKDIIFFWVSRMIMAGLEFTGEVPFRDVYMHGMARDDKGRKLSKSLGNSPDPIDLMNKYSADALRFGIMSNIPLGGDIFISDETYISGRNFCTKLWNASRLFLINLEEGKKVSISGALDSVVFEDKWILSRLNSTIKEYTKAMEDNEFSQAAHSIYHFFWGDVCDWYLEIIKPRLYDKTNEQINCIVAYFFNNILRLMHPFIPHITEELWQIFKVKLGCDDKEWTESVMIASWPESNEKLIDKNIEEEMNLAMEIIRSVRDIRNKMDIDKKSQLKAIISAEKELLIKLIKTHDAVIMKLANLSEIKAQTKPDKPAHSATAVITSGNHHMELFIPLEGVIDLEKERGRLQAKLAKAEEQLAQAKSNMARHEFRDKAPQAIVEKEEARVSQLTEQFNKLKKGLQELENW